MHDLAYRAVAVLSVLLILFIGLYCRERETIRELDKAIANSEWWRKNAEDKVTDLQGLWARHRPEVVQSRVFAPNARWIPLETVQALTGERQGHMNFSSPHVLYACRVDLPDEKWAFFVGEEGDRDDPRSTMFLIYIEGTSSVLPVDGGEWKPLFGYREGLDAMDALIGEGA